MKQVAQALTLKMVLPEMAPHPSNPDLHVLNVKVARLGALTVKGTLSYADTPRDGESQALHGSSSNNDATKTDSERQEGLVRLSFRKVSSFGIRKSTTEYRRTRKLGL